MTAHELVSPHVWVNFSRELGIKTEGGTATQWQGWGLPTEVAEDSVENVLGSNGQRQ